MDGAQVQPDAALQSQTLAAGVGDGVAEPCGAQQLLLLQPQPVVQPDVLGLHLCNGHKDALGNLPTAPDRSRGHTSMFCARFCWLSGARAISTLGARWLQGPVGCRVHGHPPRVADDQGRLGPPWLGGEEFAGPRLGLPSTGASGSPTCSHFTKSKMPGSERSFR